MQRIEALGNTYNLRLLLLLCDIVSVRRNIWFCWNLHRTQTEHQEPIRELTRVSPLWRIELLRLIRGPEMPDQQHDSDRSLEVISSLLLTSRFSFYSSNEEAGAYISTYKRFEHKPPDLIKERVDKDYASMYRTALTSISKVNKTDVETLHSSIGVSIHLSLRFSTDNRRKELRRYR
jgi:DNA excision repair protein ERCC-1